MSIVSGSLPRMSLANTELPIVTPVSPNGQLLPTLRLSELGIVSAFRGNQYIVKLIPKLKQKRAKTLPALTKQHNENREDLQRASRGHLMTFINPITAIRKAFLAGEDVVAPNFSGLESLVKYVILGPGFTKEALKKRASTLPIRIARRSVIHQWLEYLFTFHHPRLYSAQKRDTSLSKCSTLAEKTRTGYLVYIHKKSKDADHARHDIATTGKGYAKAHIDAPYTCDGIALTVSGVLP